MNEWMHVSWTRQQYDVYSALCTRCTHRSVGSGETSDIVWRRYEVHAMTPQRSVRPSHALLYAYARACSFSCVRRCPKRRPEGSCFRTSTPHRPASIRFETAGLDDSLASSPNKGQRGRAKLEAHAGRPGARRLVRLWGEWPYASQAGLVCLATTRRRLGRDGAWLTRGRPFVVAVPQRVNNLQASHGLPRQRRRAPIRIGEAPPHSWYASLSPSPTTRTWGNKGKP